MRVSLEQLKSYQSFDRISTCVVNQNTAGVIRVTCATLPLNVKIIGFAPLSAHPHAGNVERLIVAILQRNRLSFCKARRQFACEYKLVIFDDIHRVVIIYGKRSAVLKFDVE